MKLFKHIILSLTSIIFILNISCVSTFANWKCNSAGWWYSTGDYWATGWKYIDNEWYLFNSDGYMMTGWVKTDNKWYYLNDDGSMAHDCKINQYELDTDGALIEEKNKNTKETQNKINNTKANPNMTNNTFKDSENEELSYWLYNPENTDNKKMPLLIYLHGYWGANTNINSVIENEGIPKYVYTETMKIPAYVLCPYTPEGIFDCADTLKELIDNLVLNNNIDSNKISITGHSMGGFGVWFMAELYPDLFSCIVPASGFIAPDSIGEDTNLTVLPVWAIVGEKDSISIDSVEDSVKKINALGGNAKFTKLKDADHVATSTETYLNKDLGVINWMLYQTKNNKQK